MSTVGILTILSPVIMFALEQNEPSLRNWMEADRSVDSDLLKLTDSGQFPDSRVDQYLTPVRGRIRKKVIAEMFRNLRLHVELPVRASGMLMLRESGFDVPPDQERRSRACSRNCAFWRTVSARPISWC